jgi:aminodeoxyfutalosine deaminase
MPKAELHIHLEGAIQPRTVLELAKRHHRMDSLPGDTVEALQNWFRFTDFPHFVEIYVTIQSLLRSADDFALIAYENGADMAAQNIRYRELTVTTHTHTELQNKGLITIDEILAGLEAGRKQAKAEFGVEMRWVIDCARQFEFWGGRPLRPPHG